MLYTGRITLNRIDEIFAHVELIIQWWRPTMYTVCQVVISAGKKHKIGEVEHDGERGRFI